jgi:hypothetical protein
MVEELAAMKGELCQCEPAFCHTCTVSSRVKIDHIVGKLLKALSLSSSSFLLVISFEDKDASVSTV